MKRLEIQTAVYAAVSILLFFGKDCNAFAGLKVHATPRLIQSFHSPAASYQQSTSTSLLMRNNGDEIEGTDRILACLPYLLPLMDGDRYGKLMFQLVPALGLADAVLLGPFKLVYTAIPFGQLVAFFGLSFLSRRTEIPRSVRFSIQQALILDILLIFPSLFGELNSIIPIPRVLADSGSNFIFYVLVASVGYSLFSNLTGKVPNQIPIVSQASDMQIGPY